MPYPRVEPVSEKIMLDQTYHGHFSICQKLRDIYVTVDDELLKMELRVCMAMAKKMNDRLQYYKHKEEEEKRNESVNL